MNFFENKMVSFIIPVFNTDKMQYLKCIKSILQQNLKYYEILVIDDGSTSIKTKNAIETSIRSFKNIKYFFQNNQGSASARNVGIKNAVGDYIVFVDADDLIPNNFYNKANIENNDFEIAIFDYSIVKGDEEITHSLNKYTDFSNNKNDLLKNILYVPGSLNDFIIGSIWAKCFSRKFLVDHNILFRNELRKTQDRIFMLDACLHASSIIYSPQFSYKYYLLENSITHKLNFNVITYCEKLINCTRTIIEENNLDNSLGKFFAYSVLGEVLQLTYFHKDFKGNWTEIKKGILNLYELYNIDNDLKSIKIKEIPTVRSKIRFVLFKYHLFYPLYFYFR